MEVKKVQYKETGLSFNPENLSFTIAAGKESWNFDPSYRPYFMMGDEKIFFDSAREIKHSDWITGVGCGIRSEFSGFCFSGKEDELSFQTVVWIEYATQDIYFELTPLKEAGALIGSFYWPGEMEFTNKSRDWYTVINQMQGLLIPNNWESEVKKLLFDGQLCSAGAYMPWFGQVRSGASYIAIVCDASDAGYQVDHPAGGDYCSVSVRWLPSLGKMAYKRTMKMRFLEGGDYNDLCKVYREEAKEKGLFVTLKEKCAKNPLVEKFIGSAIVHTGIKTHVSPDSAYYDKEDPTKNDSVYSFSHRQNQLENIHKSGLEKVYLHLDGWGQPGYDNQHPDYLPACQEAGGYEAMKELCDKVKEMGYLFAIHDQYRDYYFDAKTYDPEFSIVGPDGKKPDFCRWAGGWQTYICASQSPLYLRRNFSKLKKEGITLDGAYLDVFTCNEPDECNHPWHRMTRKESLEYRKRCFDYLNAQGILPSSEEVTDWAIPSVVTAHYGPYSFMLEKDKPAQGIPVPLFNLVYHECVVLPWLMDESKPQGDFMLYALLNGGAPYLDPELEGEQLSAAIERCRRVTTLQEKIACCEMVRHTLLDEDGKKQKAEYSDGTVVTIDLGAGTYSIQ